MAAILQIMQSDKNLSSFLKGLKATDWEESLTGIGPFTILAPVNIAFANLYGPDTFDALVKHPIKQYRLSAIMGNHIVIGKKLLKDFRNGQKLRTINGKELSVAVKDDEVYINAAKILSRDRQGHNGVVHCINTVNLPVEEVIV